MNTQVAKELFYRPGDERIALSYCFKDLDSFYELSSKLSTSDFLSTEHQLIYTMLNSIINNGVTKVDLALFVNQAQGDGTIDLMGGIPYIQSIANIEAAKENFNIYLDNILDASTKYRTYVTLQQHMEDIEKNAQAGKSGTDLIGQVEASMLDMSSINTLNKDAILFGDTISEYLDERKDKAIKMSGLSTGFPILDRQIDGLIAGTLTIIAARKKMGKSAFLTNIALHCAYRLKIPVLYIDTELTYNEWKTRSLSIISGVKERDIKHGGYSQDALSKLSRAQSLISSGKVYHKYMPGFTVDKVVSLCKKYKLREDIGLIVFDYLKEPDLNSVSGDRKEYQLLGDITTKLKDLAGILDLPVLTAVQLNRQNDIADSDRIARYGDIVAMWGHRTDEEKKQCGIEGGQYKLVIRDTRRGGSTPAEGIGYTFYKSRVLIREVPPEDQYFMSPGDQVTNVDEYDEQFKDTMNPYANGDSDEIY